uniref:Uncharacterized protein n=1 Tax=viral metagenome TaxID=1070528 RepID=A0A6H1Z5W0_9ZZZZ
MVSDEKEKIEPFDALKVCAALSSCVKHDTDYGAFYYVGDSETLYVVSMDHKYTSVDGLHSLLLEIFQVAKESGVSFVQFITHRKPVIRMAEGIIQDKINVIGYLVKVRVD